MPPSTANDAPVAYSTSRAVARAPSSPSCHAWPLPRVASTLNPCTVVSWRLRDLTSHRIPPMLRRMKMTSRAALLLALVLALAAPALAATFTTGKYQGNTSQKKKNGKKRKISFHADNAAQQ